MWLLTGLSQNSHSPMEIILILNLNYSGLHCIWQGFSNMGAHKGTMEMFRKQALNYNNNFKVVLFF